MKKLFRKSIVLLLALTVLCVCNICAFAADSDSQMLVIRYFNNGVAVEGAKTDVYRIGYLENGEIVPEGDFASLPVSYVAADTQQLSNLALTLEPFAVRNEFAPTASSITDASGTTTFDGYKFSEGVYLLSVSTVEINGVSYLSSPIIFSLPYSQDGGTDDAVVLEVKSEAVHSESEPISIKALKVWQNDEEDGRSEKVTVDLLRNGEVYSTAVLSKGNDWSHTWENLDPMARWSIIETDVPGFYTVGVSLEGITFVVTNDGGTPDYEPDGTEPFPDDHDRPGHPDKDKHPDKDRLPDTGTNLWMVPYVAIFGMVMLLAGYVRYRKSASADE